MSLITVYDLERRHSPPQPSQGVKQALEMHGLSLEYRYTDKLPIEGVSIDDLHTGAVDTFNGLLFDVKVPQNIGYVATLERGLWYYQPHGSSEWVAVAPPCNEYLVLDTETYGLAQSRPAIAVAACSRGTYAYVHTPHHNPHSLESRIPLGDGNVVAGWNVSFDRAQMRSTFRYHDDNLWLDYMSIIVAMHGHSNQQAGLVRKIQSGKCEYVPEWYEHVCGRSLKAAAQYFGLSVDKSQRDIIVDEGYAAFKGNLLHDSIQYCFDDVLLTAKVGRLMIAAALRWYHPVSLRALMLRNTQIMPLSEAWVDYLDRNEPESEAILERVSQFILDRADALLESGPTTEQHEELDWTLLKAGKNKGLPRWYVDIRKNPSLGVRVVPYIIGLHYRGAPMFLDDNKKWVAGGKHVPHPETGLPISNAFVKGSRYEGDGLSDLLTDVESLTNWKSMRKQIAETTYVRGEDGTVWHCPRVVAWGTISRREASSIWMQVPNPKEHRLGTEARMLIQAPKGYTLVTFDVDSEEAMIAAIMGDAHAPSDYRMDIKEPLPGATPFSLSALAGDKGEGTDIHSLAAKKPGIARASAKGLVYGGLYGQGVKGASDSLYKAGVAPEDCDRIAQEFTAGFKGVKRGNAYHGGLASYTFTALDNRGDWNAKTLAFNHPLPRSLQGHEEFATTRKNWVIQSTGSDILDIITTVFDNLATSEGIRYRFVMFHHDCVSVMVEDDAALTERVAVLLQRAHATAWLHIYQKLGFKVVPTKVLIASSTEVGPQYKHGKTPKYSVNLPVKELYPSDISSSYWNNKQ